MAEVFFLLERLRLVFLEGLDPSACFWVCFWTFFLLADCGLLREDVFLEAVFLLTVFLLTVPRYLPAAH